MGSAESRVGLGNALVALDIAYDSHAAVELGGPGARPDLVEEVGGREAFDQLVVLVALEIDQHVVAALGVVTGIGLYLTAILGTALALFILEFDRMPGLRGLHRRVTGRPDMDEEDQS